MTVHIIRAAKAEMDRAEKAYKDEQARLLAAEADSKTRRQILDPLMAAYHTAQFNFKSVRHSGFQAELDYLYGPGNH